MGAGALSRLLDQLKGSFGTDVPDEVLVGMEDADDALVWKLSDDNALIATIDFFAPIVDDPYHYGAIAAANAMSDVFAMGGRVAFALNVAAFPKELSADTAAAILRGGQDKVREAGGIVGGGHTIVDKEPKYGLCVIGFVHPAGLLTKAGARPGDLLYLTKPCGTGLITTAAKGRKADPEHLQGAIESMLMLNRPAAEAAVKAGVRTATDVTGFALLGHAAQMAEHSDVDLEIEAGRVPFLDGARDYGALSLFPGGTFNNIDYYGSRLRLNGSLTETDRRILMTPETSGGLLLAVGEGEVAAFERELNRAGQNAWRIGRVDAGRGVVRVDP
jgi:selenide,water dikinase